ncbi:MAG: protein-L-isoaspartate(D-aspartate) O-methyltransferase [Saprospiraceae bacterium]|jgi:protein-L-isoaspartate(D-aspartate) O-methyltransferase
MIDSYRHKGMRKNMLQELSKKGISNLDVIKAMEEVPRHLFLDNAFLEIAYENKAFPIGCGQTISHPYTVAFQSQMLNIKKGDKVLEIGTGCGYQTSVLAKLGAKVFSIERHRPLFMKTKALLKKLSIRATLFYGDGYAGQKAFAPFDKIIVTAAAPFIPDALVQQLAVNGLMIIPVGEGKNQTMMFITKKDDGTVSKEEKGVFSFVPMLEDKA